MLPVPLLMAAFRWLDRVEPFPWRNLVFAFAWGACAATLIAILANTFATAWLATATADPAAPTPSAPRWSPPSSRRARRARPYCCCSSSAGGLHRCRRRHRRRRVHRDRFRLHGEHPLPGQRVRRGPAFGSDGLASVTATTFFVRIVLSPFAHPLFTVLTGIAFGIAASAAAASGCAAVAAAAARACSPWACTRCGTALAAFGPYGFYAVYGLVHGPCLRPADLAGDLVPAARAAHGRAPSCPLTPRPAGSAPAEPLALASMRARSLARDWPAGTLRRDGGRTASRSTRPSRPPWLSCATGAPGRAPGRTSPRREQELLHHLWQRRERGRARP